LHLKTDKTIATIELNSAKIKKLHNACLMKQEFETALILFDNAEKQHKKVVDFQKKIKKTVSLGKLNKRIENLLKDYAKLEIQQELAAIEEVMSPCW
jgi:hypothetical protein